MTTYRPLREAAKRITVPVGIVGFAIAFYFSSAHLPFMSAGYPRFIILLLLAAVAVVIGKELWAVHKEYAAIGDRTDADRAVEESDKPAEDQPRLGSVILAGLIVVGFCLITNYFGIRIGVLVFTPVMLLVTGYTNIAWIIFTTALLYAVVEVLFIWLFRLPLPGVW